SHKICSISPEICSPVNGIIGRDAWSFSKNIIHLYIPYLLGMACYTSVFNIYHFPRLFFRRKDFGLSWQRFIDFLIVQCRNHSNIKRKDEEKRNCRTEKYSMVVKHLLNF